MSDNLIGVLWKIESIQDVKRAAEQVVNLAGWLSYKEKGDENLALSALCKKAIDFAQSDTLRKAQIILKKYPEFVPSAESNQLRWPEDAKAKWRQVFAEEPPTGQTWE